MRSRTRLLACSALLALAACSNSPGGSAAEHYRRGEAALAAGDPRTARVELLNAIKADPDSRAARLLQARIYLALKEGGPAEAELLRARRLGVKPALSAHLMAHSLLLQGRSEEALAEASQASPQHAVYASRMEAQALMDLGRAPDASAAIARALQSAPDDAEAWLDAARLRRANGDLAGAIMAVDRSVSLAPKGADALVLRGELTRSQYGLTASLQWFDRALALDPTNVTGLLERAATYGDMGAMRSMLADTRTALKLDPRNPTAFYLQASLAARARLFPLARSLYARTEGALDANPAAMLLASAIDLQTGAVEPAATRLARLVAAQPDNGKARRLLASARWRLADAKGTAEALRPIADRGDADSYSLSLMGQALTRIGDAAGAARYLARAARPQQVSEAALFSEPVSDAEIQALRSLADAGGGAEDQVRLIRGLLAKGLGDEALRRARALQAKNPGAPDAHVLVGDALGTQGLFPQAAEEYRKAANLAFTEPVALRLIEALDRSGRGNDATRVLQLFLGQNPRNVPGQLLAAGRFMAAGDWAAAIPIYEGLRTRLGNRDAVMLNNLAWAYAQQGEFERAIPLAQQAWSLDRDNPATADTLGWILLKSGRDRAQGLALLEQAARGAPTDAQILRHLEQARGS